MRNLVFLLSAAGAAFALAACTMSDDQLARLVVAPDKYATYNCDAIARETKKSAEREQELQRLMAKADVDVGGRLVSSAVYRPDYITVRGELNELHAAAAAKHCTAPPAGSTAPTN